LRGTAPSLSTSDETIFSALADIYLAEHGPSMAPRSLERAEEIIDLHLRPGFGDVAIAELKAIHIRRYQRLRQEDGASPATVNREWNTIRAILNFAEQNELIERNPIRRGAIPPIETSGPRKDFFEPEEWRAFLAAFGDADRWRRYLQELRDKKPIRLVHGTSFGSGTRRPGSNASKLQLARLRETIPVFRALLYTASRAGEIIAANRADADRRRGLITIHQEKTRREKTLPIVEPFDEILDALPSATPAAPLLARSDGRRFYVHRTCVRDRARAGRHHEAAHAAFHSPHCRQLADDRRRTGGSCGRGPRPQATIGN
jgi:integrase